MIDTAQLSADLGHMIADLPGTLHIGETALSAGFSSLAQGQRLTMTGDIQSLDFRCVFPVSALGATPIPDEGDAIVATPPGRAATNCRVQGKVFPQGGVSVILELAIDRRNPFPQAPILIFGESQIDYADNTLAYGGITP